MQFYCPNHGLIINVEYIFKGKECNSQQCEF